MRRERLFFLLILLKFSKSFTLLSQHHAGKYSLPTKKHFNNRDGVAAIRRNERVSTMKLSNENAQEGSYGRDVAKRLDKELPKLPFQIPQLVAICIPTFRINCNLQLK